jgi:hypothetical protein
LTIPLGIRNNFSYQQIVAPPPLASVFTDPLISQWQGPTSNGFSKTLLIKAAKHHQNLLGEPKANLKKMHARRLLLAKSAELFMDQ